MTDRELDRLLMEASSHVAHAMRALQDAREGHLLERALVLANEIVLARRALLPCTQQVVA